MGGGDAWLAGEPIHPPRKVAGGSGLTFTLAFLRAGQAELPTLNAQRITVKSRETPRRSKAAFSWSLGVPCWLLDIQVLSVQRRRPATKTTKGALPGVPSAPKGRLHRSPGSAQRSPGSTGKNRQCAEGAPQECRTDLKDSKSLSNERRFSTTKERKDHKDPLPGTAPAQFAHGIHGSTRKRAQFRKIIGGKIIFGQGRRKKAQNAQEGHPTRQ